jgi:hypothetical protein
VYYYYFLIVTSECLIIKRRKSIGDYFLPQRHFLEQLVCSVEIVVDDDQIVHIRFLGVCNLLESGGEPLLGRSLCLGSAALKTRAKGREGGGRDEEVDGIQGGGFDLAHTLRRRFCSGTRGIVGETYLGLDVQDAAAALFVNETDSLEAGTVEVAREFCMLDEGTGDDQVLEFLGWDEEVLLSMNFSWTWGTGSV